MRSGKSNGLVNGVKSVLGECVLCHCHMVGFTCPNPPPVPAAPVMPNPPQ